MKHLLIVVLMLSCSAAVSAQQQTAVTADAAIKAAGDSAPPQLKAEDLLKIRNVQYEKVKRALQMTQIEAAYKALQEQQEAGSRRLDDLLTEAVKAAGVDTTKWIFDLEQLRFSERPAAATSPGKKEDK